MKTLLLIVLPLVVTTDAAAQVPSMNEDDRIRLVEAFHLAATVADDIWEGWGEVPFAVLLIAEDHEFLVRHPRPGDDFASVGFDELLDSEVLVRDRVFPPNLLASFPAIGGVPTVVIGRPEATGKTSTHWVLTALHEHFHQLQMGQPGYTDGVRSLHLADGDETGMWMINYPFPYDDPHVHGHVLGLRDALVAALDDPARSSAYGSARQRLSEVLAPADFRYLSFQMWQEGVARYTELRVAEAASRRHEPLPAFAALDDFVPYAVAAEELHQQLHQELTGLDLEAQQRVAFYPLGAAEALLLDLVSPGWQERYFTEPFHLEGYATPEPEADPADVASAEAIIAALYDVISGGAGVERDWDRFRSLFAPGARLIPTGQRPDGERVIRVQTPDDYIETSGPFLLERGFFEIEIARSEERFGNIAHVWSTYEARWREDDPEPFMRGINSIQLFDDGNRWWVVTVMWDSEREGSPIPEDYLPTELQAR